MQTDGFNRRPQAKSVNIVPSFNTNRNDGQEMYFFRKTLNIFEASVLAKGSVCTHKRVLPLNRLGKKMIFQAEKLNDSFGCFTFTL